MWFNLFSNLYHFFPQIVNDIYAGMRVVKHDKSNKAYSKPLAIGSGSTDTGRAVAVDILHLAPLLHLQRCIATCFEEAHVSYKDMPEVASQVRKGATMCRAQLIDSVKMLKKIDQTASSVLDMFPDLVNE